MNKVLYRLIIIITIIIIFNFIYTNNQLYIALFIAISLVILFYNRKIRLLLYISVPTTFLFILFGNWYFLNDLEKGMFESLKRISQLLVGYSWIAKTSKKDFISMFPFIEDKKLILLLKSYEDLKNYFFIIKGSIVVRLRLHQYSFFEGLKFKLLNSYLFLEGYMRRIINLVPFITYLAYTFEKDSKQDVDKKKKYNIDIKYLELKNIQLKNFYIPEGTFAKLQGTEDEALHFMRTISYYNLIMYRQEYNGEIYIGGKPFTGNEEEILSSIIYVPRFNESLFIHEEVMEELRFYSDNQTLINRLLEYLDIMDKYEDNIQYLSSGQKTKLLIICLLISNKKIILLNSIFDNLDKTSKVKVFTLLRYFSIFYKKTILFYSHTKIFKGKVLLIDNYKKEINHINNIPDILPNTNSRVIYYNEIDIFRNEKVLLQNFKIEVLCSDFITIIGNNGTGKTSILLALVDLIPFNQTNFNSKFSKVNFGISFQNSYEQFVKSATIEELQLLSKIHNLNFIQNDFFDKKDTIKDLTLYEIKILSIYSMYEETDIILIDEPTIGFTIEEKYLFLLEIEKMRKQNKAIIIATHDKYIINNSINIINLNQKAYDSHDN